MSFWYKKTPHGWLSRGAVPLPEAEELFIRRSSGQEQPEGDPFFHLLL